MKLSKKQLAEKEACLEELKNQQNNNNTEYAHRHADDALCILLEVLGMGDIVVEYRKVGKWFD